MNVNFGLFPELEPGALIDPETGKKPRGKAKSIVKKQIMAKRALDACKAWLAA